MGKYQYKTQPELSSDQKEYIAKSSDLVIKTWIANELVEANRLTRFKLKNKFYSIFDKITIEEFQKELEDQA